MPRMPRYIVPLLVFSFIAAFCASGAAANRREVINRMNDFRNFFVDFQYAPDSSIPGDLLAQCHGIIIMNQYKAGFVVGVRGGDGVVLLHDPATGSWSAPAFVRSAEGSFGFQIGGQAIDAVILIMNRDGIDMLLKSRFKIGVDASAAAGPVGRDASAKVGPGTALLAYSRAQGLYAGVAFEGGALLNHDSYNKALYGRDIGIKEILIDNAVPVPPEAGSLIEALSKYSVNYSTPSAPPAITPVRPAPAPPASPERVEPLRPMQPIPHPQAEQPAMRPLQPAPQPQPRPVAPQPMMPMVQPLQTVPQQQVRPPQPDLAPR